MEFAAVHDVVDFAVMFFEYNELARTAIWQFSKNARTHHARIIENDKVSGFKKVGKIGIFRIGNIAGLTIENEQASSAANFGRANGDFFFG